MTESQPQPDPAAAPERAADWEAFYRDYRKPGYVSGFEITTKLGGGMFGLVYRARKESIGKDYAIKFLRVDDGEVRRAVLLELEQVRYFAQIDHPNLVSIEDKGEVDGIPYLVMQFAGTETLRDRMPTDGKPPTAAEREELLRWFLQCCRGLGALHERSLVHFDIKPANVFLKGAVARLGDYGLSKLVTHSRGSLSMGRGTPYYMAPELLQRRGDQRSDIYSLGVMLYEILCGRVPFTGDSEWEVLRQHETARPELPEHLSALERAVLQRCLQKDPAARYQSVQDLIAAFGAQTGVGAAAWSDVRAGAGQAPPQPPPLPKVPPPPLSGPQRHAEDAMRRAQRAAEQALGGMRQFARATAGAIGDTARELRRDGSGRSMRHRRAMAKLRARFHWPPRVARSRAPAPGRSGGWRTAMTIVGALVLGLFVLGFLLMLVVPSAAVGGSVTYGVGGAMPLVEAPRSDPTRSATYTRFGIPRRYTDLVSTAEPAWVALAQRDRDRAARTLAERLAEMHARVPCLPAARAEASDLPTFEGVRTVDPATRRRIDGLLRQVLDADTFDIGLASQFAEIGPVALAEAAARLGQIRYADVADVERARRLQAILERATGCLEIPIVAQGALEAIARGNRHLGELWAWFLNEVGHSDRAWQTYRSLNGIR